MVAKAGEPGRRKDPWTDDQVQKLQELWGTMGDAGVALGVGKTLAEVRRKAGSLHLREKKGKRTGSRPGKVVYPWEHWEENVLTKNLGHLSVEELKQLLPRRNRSAIERKAYDLGFTPTQGAYTRGQIERDTAYDWRQIRRAKDALGQAWKRYGERKYMISEEQRDEIVEYLAHEKRQWSREYGIERCVRCGNSGDGERDRHSGDGLCKRCWDLRRHTRKWIEKVFVDSEQTVLTREIWLRYLCDDATDRLFVIAQMDSMALTKESR